MGNISLALGVVALVTAVFVVGGAVGLVGLVLGVVGLRRVHRGEATNLRAAAAGAVLSGIALVATVGLLLQSASFVSTHRSQVTAYDRCIAAASTATARAACAH